MRRRTEARLPDHLAGLDVEGLEVTIEVTDERQATTGGKCGGHEHGALRVRPARLQGGDIDGTQATEHAVGPGHGMDGGFTAKTTSA